MIDLIVFDIWGTLLGTREKHNPDGSFSYVKRNGVKEFLELNPRLPVTYYTDADRQENEKEINQGLAELGIVDRLRKPDFYVDSMVDAKEGKYSGYKDLLKVADEYQVHPQSIVLIGDSSTDKKSAERYKSKLIIVPPLNFVMIPNFELDRLGNLEQLFKDRRDGVEVWWSRDNGLFEISKGHYYEIVPNVPKW